MDSVLLGSVIIIFIGVIVFLLTSMLGTTKQKTRALEPSDEKNRREQIISIISHQLRTPLSIVRGYLEALNAEDLGKLNAQQKEYVTEAGQINANMIEMVNKYIEILNTNAEALTVTKTQVNITALLQKTAKHFTTYATATNASIELKIPKKPVKIQTDAHLLQSSIDTLVQNSMKYSGGSTTITLSLDEQPDAVVITVADTGLGIPKSQQKNVFSKFFRGDNILHRSIAGSGLGLFVVKEYVEALKGSITFESEEGRGTRMHITLPRS